MALSLVRLNFINQIAALAVKSCKGTGLFASVMIAQACVETGNGTSDLSKKYYNYFGIKSSAGWKGRSVSLKTGEVINDKDVTITAAFRAYDTIQEGFADRNNFLKVNPRYTKAGVFTAQTPEDQVRAFVTAGYATGRNYDELIINIIKNYELTKYDN